MVQLASSIAFDPGATAQTRLAAGAQDSPAALPAALPTAAENQRSSRPPQRPWLDTRPRTPANEGSQLVPAGQLPPDVSGLAEPAAIPQAVGLNAVDLRGDHIWAGSSFRYRPLYFEDRSLERYGSIGAALEDCPSLRAGAHFAWSAATLPLSMLHYPPCRRVCSGTPSRYELVPRARQFAETVRRTGRR